MTSMGGCPGLHCSVTPSAPYARILVVGYPAILPDVQPGCWPLLPITPGDVPYLRDTEKALNAMLATEAARCPQVRVWFIRVPATAIKGLL